MNQLAVIHYDRKYKSICDRAVKHLDTDQNEGAELCLTIRNLAEKNQLGHIIDNLDDMLAIFENTRPVIKELFEHFFDDYTCSSKATMVNWWAGDSKRILRLKDSGIN